MSRGVFYSIYNTFTIVEAAKWFYDVPIIYQKFADLKNLS